MSSRFPQEIKSCPRRAGWSAGMGGFIPSTSRWATTPWPGRKLGDDGGGLVTGLQPGHGAVGRCQVNGMKRKQSAWVQAALVTVPLDSTVRSKP